MGDFFRNILSTEGFVPRRSCGDWSGGHVWLHTLSDLLIWLAYLSIPLVLGFFLWRRRATLPFRGLIALFAAFIFCCGTTHLFDALMFDWPAYRLAGLAKAVTAVVSWLTVAALVSAVPWVLRLLDAAGPQALPPAVPASPQRFAVAAALAGVALLARFGLDPMLSESRGFVLPLLAVMGSAWYGGFGPGLLALALGGGGFALLFINYDKGLSDSAGLATQAELALYVFCGFVAATLGQAQRSARLAAEAATADLHESNRQLAHSQWGAAEALTQLDAFLTHAPVGLAFFDRDLRYLRINNYLADANKRPPADHLGKTTAEVLPDFPPAVTAAFRKALDTGIPVRELPVHSTTSSDSVWHVSAYPAHDPYGVAVGLAVVAQDVTEKARQQAALRASEERFRTLWESAPVGISLSRAGTHLFTNRAFVALHGLPPGTDLAGQSVLERVAPTDRELVAERVRLRAAGEPVPDGYEIHEQRADGTEFLAELRIASLTLADGPASVCFMTDVTDRRRAQEELERRVADRTAELRREKAFLGAVLESIEDAIVACDADGALTLFNRATKRLHGLPAEPIPPARWADHYSLYAADGRTPLGRDRVPLFRALAGEDVRDAELVVAPHGAEPRTLLASGRGLFDEDGKRLGAVVSMHDITDRRDAETARAELVREQTLRQEQERFRLLADAMPQIVYVSRPDGTPEYLNRRWYEYTGLTDDSRASIQSVMHPDDLPRINERYAAVKPEQDFEIEFRLRRASDQSYRWFLTRSVAVRDAAGLVVNRFGTSTDIDDQKRTEERLAASAADLRDAQRVAQVGNWRWDVATDRVTGSAELCRIYGLDPAAGVPPYAGQDGTLYTHENWLRVGEAIRHTAATGEPAELDVAALRGGSEPIWVGVRTEAERDAAGRVATLRGTVQDITARKRAEAELAAVTAESDRRRRLYEAFLSSTPDLAYVFDLDHRFTFANPALLKMWGKTWDEAIGRTCLELGYEPWHAAMHGREIEQVKATGQPARGEVPFSGTLGRRVYEYIFVPVVGPGGQVEAVAGTTRDVTDRKAAEEAVRASEERHRTLLESLTDGFVAFDCEFRHTYANDASERLTGRSRSEVIGRTQWEVFPDSVGTTLEREFRRAMADRVTVEFENHYAPWDRYFALKVYPTPDGGIGVLYREVTDSRRAEERFQFVRRSSGIGFWYCDLPFDVLEWDERVKQHFHLPADAVVTIDTFYARIHPDDRGPTRRAIEQSMADRQPYDTVYRTVHPGTGAVNFVRAVGRTGYGADGTPVQFDGITIDVTAGKRAEVALRESEERYRTLFDTMDQGYCVIEMLAGPGGEPNHDFRYLQVNPAFERHTGFVGAVGRTIREVVPDIDAHWPERYGAVADTGVPARFVDPVAALGRWFDVYAARQGGPDSHQVAVLFSDITARKQADDALKDSEERYRALIELSPQLVWAADPAGRATYYSQAWQEYTGLSADDGSGDGWAAVVHPDDLSAVGEAWMAAVATGNDYQTECRLRRADGGYRWHLNRARLVRDAGGLPSRWIGVAVDIEDRKRAEERLGASEARFRGLTDTVPQVVWEAAPDGRLTFLNQYFEDYTGRPAGDALGLAEQWGQVIRPDHLPRVAALWGDAVKGGAPYHDLYPLRRADGAFRWFQARGRLLRSPDGTPDRWVGTATDVHDRVAAEEALAATQRTLTMSLAAANAGVYNWDLATDKVTVRTAHPTSQGVLTTSRPVRYEQWVSRIHPDDRGRAEAVVRAARLDRRPFALQYRGGDPDAGYRWVESRGQFEYAPDGTPLRAVGVRLDVHDRKAAEEAAHKADLEFRAMADSIPQLAWMTRPDGYIDWYNSRWYEYTGTTLEQMQGRGWQAVHDPAEVGRVTEKFQAHVELGIPWEDTFPLRGADGVYRWFLSRARPIRDDAGSVVRWFGTNTDVTAQRQLEADLRAVGERFRFLDQLGQATREADALATLATTARLLGGHLHATRCAYADVFADGNRFAIRHDWTDGAASTVGEYSLDLFGGRAAADMRAGRPLVVRDVDAELGPAGGADMFNAIGIKAIVCCPLVKGGRLVAMMAVHQAAPRDWTPAEIGLVTEVVERTWAHGERARAEDAAREASDRFRTLAESVPALVWTAPPHGPADYHSSRWAEFTGRPLDGLAAGGWLASVHPADRPATAAAWDRANVSGEPFAVEYRLRRADGAYRWQLAQALPQRGADGAAVRWYGTVTDIDDQKRLQGELRAVSDRFRTLTEAIPQMVWNADADGRVSYVNSRWQAYTGLSQAESGSGWWRKLGHPADVPAADAAWASAANTEAAPIRQELRLRRAVDGVYRWFSMDVVPLRRPDGSLDQWIGSLSDIHDLKTADEAIRASEAKFRQLVEAVPNLVWVTDADGRVVQLNRQWATYTGRSLDSLLGDGWAGLLHPDDAAGMAAGWQAAVRHRASYTGEFRFRTADGSYRWQLARGLPVAGADGRLSQWFGTTTDIDNQKRAAELLEVQVKERTAELARSNGELEKFAYVASHDLQEPLRKVQAFGDRLASKFAPGLGPDGKDYIERMQSSAARMQTLIQDLLAYSRVAAKPRAFGPVPLAPLVAGVLSDLEALTSRTQAVVRVGDLPTVQGDPGQLRQLFQNLIANACKFHQPDRPPTVTLTAERLEALPPHVDPPPGLRSGWRLAVSDDGIGFEQQYADKIFEVFQRLHGRGTYEGTGIGLAICRKIVERHGGIITARGRPGEGAAFAVDLPAHPGDTPQ